MTRCGAATARVDAEPGDFDHLYGELPPIALRAQAFAVMTPDVAPVALVVEAVRAAGRHLGRITILDGPMSVAEVVSMRRSRALRLKNRARIMNSKSKSPRDLRMAADSVQSSPERVSC